ncbi:MAG: RIP metalloprotease RseP [Candidatus Moraniibacteriota bacterium]
MTTLIVFIIILGVLILVHEAGHFLVAKRNGVPSEEFGFGFPPRVVGVYKNKKGKWKWVFGNKQIGEEEKEKDETVYSINLIPLGGFVKIRGESEEEIKGDPKSFVNQSAWKRFKILFAGVGMNFVLAIILFAFAFWLGLPEAINDETEARNPEVQIAQVANNTPADEIGVEMGDVIKTIEAGGENYEVTKVGQFQKIIEENKGKEIELNFERPGEGIVSLATKIREEAPEGEGLLGVQLVRTDFVKHGFLESSWMAVKTTFSMIVTIVVFLGDLIVKLFVSEPVGSQVAGPVGIAVLTGKMTQMGLAHILQFTALLSVNLGVINLLPIPALDGGRILFLLIEKIKGSPVSQKMEGLVHTIGFFLLISLMVFVTVKDFINFEIVDKIKGLFV